jgi:hypothetical protein
MDNMPNDYLIEIINPIDPKGQKVQAIIPHTLILNYYKYHPVRFENFRTVRYVLANTDRIFSGIRQFNEGGWCFTGKPKSWYIKESVQAPFPENLVFSVYLNSRLYIYEARAEKCAVEDNLCPENWQNRYGALIWKTTS